MATKTISVDEEAYERLSRARRTAKESFSKVIKRAKWDDGERRCGDLLERAKGKLTGAQIEMLERAQAEDEPPEDPWKG
jgi:predicted CopG family antitoxin